MVTGVFLFIEISYMLLLSYPIKYFFKQQILYRIHKNTHDFSFLKENKTRDFSPKK